MKRLILFTLAVYKRTLSPILSNLFGEGCIYTPTCSEYSYEAIDRFGILRGVSLTIKRLVKCNPISESSYFDPVPVKN